MAIDRQAFLETLKDSYSAYYNVHINEDMTELPLAFRADFFSKGEKYFIMKKNKIWANETNEYLYLFSAPSFDAATAEKCMDYVIEDAQPRVKPHREHNYTNFISIFIAENFEKEALKAIKKRHYDKSYNHSLYGFSMLKTAAVDINTRKIVTNSAGHDLTKFYGKLFAAQDKLGSQME